MAGFLPTHPDRKEVMRKERIDRAVAGGTGSFIDRILGREPVAAGIAEERKRIMDEYLSAKRAQFKQRKLDVIQKDKSLGKAKERIELRLRRDPEYAAKKYDKLATKTNKDFEETTRAMYKKLNEDRKAKLREKREELREQARTSTLSSLHRLSGMGATLPRGSALRTGPGSASRYFSDRNSSPSEREAAA